MALQHPAESLMLLHCWLIALSVHQTVFGGPLPHRRPAHPHLATDMEEAEEREGRGQRRLRTRGAMPSAKSLI